MDVRPFTRKILTWLLLAAPLAAVGAPESVSLTQTEGGLYHIEGSFVVQASRDEAWRVLTDYDGLSKVVSSMTASRALDRQGNSVHVRQTVLGHFLFFKRSITLDLNVVEDAPNGLTFEQLPPKKFRAYSGSWTLSDDPQGVRVGYILDVSSADMAPPFVERGLFKGNALNLLMQLKAEIARRCHLHADAAFASK
jgi:hypothetical protein